MGRGMKESTGIAIPLIMQLTLVSVSHLNVKDMFLTKFFHMNE